MPASKQTESVSIPAKAMWEGTVNIALVPRKYALPTAAVALAKATGIKLRGFHSNSSSSTARSTAEIGVLNTADIPAAAPATSSVLRSTLVR